MPSLPEILISVLPASAVSSPVCADGETICDTTLSVTGNERLAEAADMLIGKPLTIVGLLLFGFAARWVLHRMVDRLVRRAEHGVLPNRLNRGRAGAAATRQEVAGATRRVQRAKTMGSLLKSIVTGIVLAVVITMVLSEIGVNVAPIIASAGILGLAIGFGAQSLVSDFLSGIFMIFEDQYGVGDEVDLGEAIGTIEAVSLRVTRLRDLNGTVWYVRNGEILRVGNASQNWARTVLDITVEYDEDLTRVKGVLADVAHDMWDDEDYRGIVLEEPSVWGVQELGLDGVVLRVALKTAPSQQWAVARELRARIKNRFDFEGIDMASTQRMGWNARADAAAEGE